MIIVIIITFIAVHFYVMQKHQWKGEKNEKIAIQDLIDWTCSISW